jgi:hypothetical protein
MWKRHFVFWCVVLVGLAVLGASLSSQPSRFAEPREDRPTIDPTWRQTTERLDKLFADEWRAAKVQPAGDADTLVLARRLALALMGTVPSLEEIRFLQGEPREERFEQWLEHVLDDGRHHDYFAERLGRAFVGTKEGAFLVFRRRRFVSWLSDQLSADRPYDAIVRDLIEADGLWTDQPATNFLTVTIKPGQEGGQPDPNELAARVCRSMLGVRIDCAECHDHPFDRWKQRDFQGLAAFFAGVQISPRGIRDQPKKFEAENRKTGKTETIASAVPFEPQLLPVARETNDAPRARLAAWVTSSDNRRFSLAIVNRVWALMFGRGLVNPVDDIRDEAALPPALVDLANDFAEHDFNLRRLVRIIAHSTPFRRESRLDPASGDGASSDSHAETGAVFPLTRLRPEQVAGSVIQAASLTTIDQQAHLIFRLGRYFGENDFIKRYGDVGEDELTDVGSTIPQRLLMMNGKLVTEKTRQNPLMNAVTQIGQLSPDDTVAIEATYLTVLTRLPSDAEREHFVARLGENRGRQRLSRLEDLYWTLLNSTEFSWNH